MYSFPETTEKVVGAQVARLQALKGKWGSIATDPEIGYSWLVKYSRGQITRPGLHKVLAVERALRGISSTLLDTDAA